MNDSFDSFESVDGQVAALPKAEETAMLFSAHEEAYLLEWLWSFEDVLAGDDTRQAVENSVPVRIVGRCEGIPAELDPMDLADQLFDELPYTVIVEGLDETFAAYLMVPADEDTTEVVRSLKAACDALEIESPLKLIVEEVEQLDLRNHIRGLNGMLGFRPAQLDALAALAFTAYGMDQGQLRFLKDPGQARENLAFWEDQYHRMGA